MNALITGGTGLIGRTLTADLIADGYNVTILSRSPERYRDSFPGEVSLVRWDGATSTGWGHLIEDTDAVINLAGESIAGHGFPPARWTHAKKQRILTSRLNAAEALTEAIRNAAKKPSVFIQASAVGYYGGREDEILKEDDLPGEGFTGEFCIDWEASVADIAGMGVRCAAIRTGVVLSMESGAFPSLVLPFRFFVGGPIGGGRQFVSWIHIEDQIRAIRFLLENEISWGPYNLTAPEPVRNTDLAELIGEAMNRQSWFNIPAWALKAAFGEVSTVLLDSQRVIPAKLEAEGFQFKYRNAREAVADLLV